MNGLPKQTWRCRVAELLSDPVVQAVLRRDRLTHEQVLAQLTPIAEHLRRNTSPERPARRLPREAF
ncbi:hypothetical protein ABAZ39_32805 (plasmid) [Azospirillum argentinense]|uniref:Uncharacterized protein n=1 Tax=Azospirillum argentinense TaxID=2970906 RepID=A0A5B0KXE9_9PROT|nr:hypothetical protein [Azospirillum argentinense]AIB16620.1 hypothetical protein ABAZ39_32805 [Azospirillum argentinense]EZQ02970.1 hypothetical protein ABAZ39_31625 [Azospirillum argentinense]KAA1056685.1 hypothetical protein FH063_003558 [Azospirillum argentinense]PNQ97156.1 hypothetical protein C1S70_19835 [Azospirillum argentinense]QCN99281.1 hypothetical protein D3093_29010 [Azospirillum argentinense]